jgi:CRP/FNR family transcriptional regulator, anaerobic regulatory protein
MTALATDVRAIPVGKPYASLALAPVGNEISIDIEAIREHVPVRRCKHAAGQGIYHAGQPFQALYLVHAGSYKTCELADDGREQVTGFRMRGDLVGVESIGLKTYACDVIALEDSEAWELPYPAMLRACLHMPELQSTLTSALAAEIRCDRSWMLMLGTLAAERRVAAFLLDVAARYARLGYSAKHFILGMSRIDMASFLALKHETVSRALSRLHDLNYIDVQRREVHVLDIDGLRAMAGVSATVN